MFNKVLTLPFGLTSWMMVMIEGLHFLPLTKYNAFHGIMLMKKHL
jgi:hypothetical protein